MSRLGVALAVAVLVVAASGCNSTTRTGAQAVNGVRSGDRIGPEGVDAAATTPDGTGATKTSTAASNATAAERAAAARAAAGAAGKQAANGTVKIGVRYPNNSQALIASVGFSGVNPGDSKAMAQAVVDDVNAHGGIAGRRIEPVYFPFDVTGSTAPGGGDSEQQKACATFTEDNLVFAVVSPIISGPILQDCLNKEGVVFVEDNWGFFDPTTAGPGYWNPSYPDAVRGVSALVDRLVTDKVLGPAAKIGAVFQEYPDRRRVLEQGLRPALARHGLKIDDTVAWTASNAQQLSVGVLRFKTEGVTHVFILDPSGLETFGWMTESESQTYRPKQLIDTRNYPFLQAGQSPAAQLENTRGIGWVPSADLGLQTDAERSSADKHCLAVVAKAGQNMNDATNVRVAMAFCDTFDFLKRAAGSASPLTLAAVRSGGEAMGDHFVPTGSFATRFGPGRHDGAAAARDLVFDGPCGCFRYSGPVFSIG